MNGPDEHDDGPDDVTLWSGRLRAWPVAPGVDESADDDTVSTRRTTSVGGAASSPAASRHDLPLVPATLPDDRAPHAPPDVAAPLAIEDVTARQEIDDITAPRAPDQVTMRAALLDVTAPSEPDDVTAPTRSRAAQAGAGRSRTGDPSAIPDAIDDDPPASVVDTSTAPRAGIEPRLTASVADTAADARPRGIRPPVPVVHGEPPAGREARSPVALQREAYAPRVDEPARVARASAVGTARSGDAALVHPRRGPSRARLAVLTAAVVAVVVLAAVGVALLLA